MLCEMCGKQAELFKTSIEGTELNVCRSCSKYGKVLKRIREPIKEKPKKPVKIEIVSKEPETEELVVEDYAKRIKQKREQMDLTQEKLAKKLNEKESLLQKIESGHMKPSLRLAKKLQNFLGIKLIEEFKPQKRTHAKTSSGPLTIGDLITIKRK